MLNKFKNFSKSKLGAIVVGIVAIPFVFYGMGSVFQNKDVNNVAKIGNYNISTKDFVNHINQTGLNPDIIRKNIDKDILKELLNDLLARKFIELEVKKFDLNISDSFLVNLIKNNKNFHDDENKFDRIKYEKFLIENNINAPDFEKKLKNRELEKKLFQMFDGGLKMPNFIVNKNNDLSNSIIELESINLEKFYQKEFSNEEIDNFIKENEESFKKDFISFTYAKVTPNNLVNSKEYNEVFFQKIDELEYELASSLNLEELFKDHKNIKVDSIKNYNPQINAEFSEIFINRNDSDIQMIDKNEYFLFFKINNLVKKLPNQNDSEFKKQIINSLNDKKKFEFNKKIFDKISKNNYNYEDFKKLSNNINLKNITLKSINDNNFLDINSVKYIYSSPKGSFLLVSDNSDNIYLVMVKDIIKNEFNINSNQFSDLYNQTKENLKNEIYASYDLYLNNEYKVIINQNSIERLKNYFK
tara:strand:- start:1490 stop:2905 length:1416 start_codon:yes stop_codon:yes gene_type:complete